MSPYKTISPLAKYKDEIDRLKVALDAAFGAGTRANPSAVEDRIIFPLGVATRDLSEEVIWFVHQGFGNAALRTSRTLYECVVFCLYINKHPDSWENYLGTMHSQWAKIMQNVPGADRNLPQIHNVLLERVPKYGRGKTAFISLRLEQRRYDIQNGSRRRNIRFIPLACLQLRLRIRSPKRDVSPSQFDSIDA